MAAASLDATDDSIKATIKEVFNKQKTQEDPLRYKLTFEIGGKTFSTIFSFNYYGIKNECLELNYYSNTSPLSSSIKANSPDKRCFDPPLIPSNLPEKISGTDIIQTLSTKLKFITFDTPSLHITDIARLPPSKTSKKLQITPFSLWRILQGKDTLYEKYGYTHPDLEKIKKVVTTTPWSAIKDLSVFYDVPTGKSLQELVYPIYPDIFKEDMSIATGMSNIKYEDADKLIVRHPNPSLRNKSVHINPPYAGQYTLAYLIMEALYSKGLISHIIIPELIVDVDSEIWKSWDSRLQFVGFDRVIESAMGGARRSRRRRINHHRSLNVINMTHRRSRIRTRRRRL